MFEISHCEVCGNRNLSPVLNLGKHPLCDDLLAFGSDQTCAEYPIEILFCEECFTAHQRYQVPKSTLFTQNYHYRAQRTGSVLLGMSDLVDRCEQLTGALSNKTILDIGCNDGSLLNFFRAKGCETFGIEPTGAAAEAKAAGHDVIHGFFDKDTVDAVSRKIGQPDFITFTNVFAHIENLDELISNLKALIGEKTVVVIENHYLGAILKTGQFDTFYHEHPRTYSYRSFVEIAQRLSLNLSEVQFVSRYGGNIRAFLSRQNARKSGPDESDFGSLFGAMVDDLNSWRKEASEMIARLVRQHGPLRAKAFPGRAAILIKLLNLSVDQISAVYEIKGSIKVGHYVPGTRIPILPEAELFKEPDLTKPIVNLAWHLPAEVRANLASHGYTGPVFDLKVLHQ